MKAVEDRKKEQERREERKIQKEREAEGEKFSDKDAYVTSAYKLKLQEQKEELEREKREAQIEGATDTLLLLTDDILLSDILSTPDVSKSYECCLNLSYPKNFMYSLSNLDIVKK